MILSLKYNDGLPLPANAIFVKLALWVLVLYNRGSSMFTFVLF